MRNIKGHEAKEALTYLKYEIDMHPPPGTSTTHIAFMKAMLFSIARSSYGR